MTTAIPPLNEAAASAAAGLSRRQLRREIDARRLKARWINRRHFQVEPEWIAEWRRSSNQKAPDSPRRPKISAGKPSRRQGAAPGEEREPAASASNGAPRE